MPIDFLTIIPTFRRPGYLVAAVKSVLAQSEVTKQIIVVDDCPDGSAEKAVRGLGADVIYIRNPHPTGGWPGKVRNHGFDAALKMGIKSAFVHFLDDDDITPAGHYALAKQTFAQHPDIGVLFGTLVPFCEYSSDAQLRRRQEAAVQGAKIGRIRAAAMARFYHAIDKRSRTLGQWLYRQHSRFCDELFVCSAGMIKFEHVKALQGFDPNTRITEDYEFYSRAIVRFGAHFLDRPAAYYRVGSNDSLWNPVDSQAMQRRESEARRLLRRRQTKMRSEMKNDLKFYAVKIAFRSMQAFLHRTVG